MPVADDQQMMLETAADIARNEFAENALQWEEETPWENWELLSEHGYLGINFASEYGGADMSEYDVVRLIDTIGRVCPETARWYHLQGIIAGRTIEMFGSELVKRKFLPEIIDCDEFVSIGISEPQAGSDVKAMETTVSADGDTLLLDGEKMWVSDIPDATACIVWVKFPEGIGSVIVDLDTDGVEIGSQTTNMAGEVHSQLFFNDVVIPEENVLVRGRDQWKEQLKALNWERISSAAMTNATALCSFKKALEYAQQREQFGQPIAEFQGIEWKLVDMWKEIEASRSLTHRAAERAHKHGRVPDQLFASLVKLYGAEMVEYVTSEALQLFGANGYQRGHDLEYLYRMARRWRIAGGTDEIQKNTVATALKKQGIPSYE